MASNEPATETTKEKFLNRAERKKCWASRDAFWACLDKCSADPESNPAQCRKEREAYTADCPTTWVTHFDRKYKYEKFKVMLKKDGFQEAADEAYTNKANANKGA